MTTAHTPGPLRVVRAKNGGGDFAVMDGHKNIVAEFYEDIREQGECASKEAKANANIFASASELLQELQAIANADTAEWTDRTEFEAWAKSRARAAIAKATGAAS